MGIRPLQPAIYPPDSPARTRRRSAPARRTLRKNLRPARHSVPLDFDVVRGAAQGAGGARYGGEYGSWEVGALVEYWRGSFAGAESVGGDVGGGGPGDGGGPEQQGGDFDGGGAAESVSGQ